MAAGKRKKGISHYILPTLFCGLLVALALLNRRQTEQPVKAVLQEGEPLTLTEQAVENYLYAAGCSWTGEEILSADGSSRGTLSISKGSEGPIEGMTLTFPLPTYYETEDDVEALLPLKADHDAAARQGEELFLALFDAVAATDGRVAARRESALEKLRGTMDTGKSAAQAANSWRFSFSLEPGELEGTITILFTLVK